MAEPRDIQEALREAVDKTVQATLDTRERAAGAVDELTGGVREVVRGAEQDITRRRQTVREAVGDRLPATQEDLKELRSELRALGKRLDSIEERLAEKP